MTDSGALLRRWQAGSQARRLWIAAGRSGRPLPIARAYLRYLASWRAYSRLEGAERLAATDSFPCLNDDVSSTPYDSHYFHQAVWAMDWLVSARPREHVDVGSDVMFVGMASSVVPVVFVDIRPLSVRRESLRCLAGDILALPFADATVESLSCLHVVEHVGLGRYGDGLAVDGTRRACQELSRVLAPGGTLLVSLPIGRDRVCFNAHRVHSVEHVLRMFPTLTLVELSLVDDAGALWSDVDPSSVHELSYGCGLFRFTT